MCNAFGGIVLIAILVALLISPSDSNSSRESKVNRESLELSRKSRELSELENQMAVLEEKYKDIEEIIPFVQKRDQLKETLKKLQESEAQSLVSLNDRLAELMEQQVEAEQELSDLTAEIAALTSEIDTTSISLSNLEEQMKQIVSSNMKVTHPPARRDASGSQCNFILRYGEIFPIENYELNDGEIMGIVENESSILWLGDTAKPIEGRGLRIGRDNQEINRILSGLSTHNKTFASRPSKRFYLISLVYGDSFETYEQLSEIIQGYPLIQDGWDPIKNNEELAFSPDGTKSQTD
jgi:gas vesicle protein